MDSARRFKPQEIEQLAKHNNLKVFYNSWAWRTLSHHVMEQQHYECYYCRQRGGYRRAVVVHHVKPLKAFPWLAYSLTYTDPVSNVTTPQLVALCRECHERVHGRTAGQHKQHNNITVERW